MSDATALSAALGGEPICIDDLSPADATRLAALIRDATDRQARALDDAIDGGMGHLPRLLRGPVKAVLFR